MLQFLQHQPIAKPSQEPLQFLAKVIVVRQPARLAAERTAVDGQAVVEDPPKRPVLLDEFSNRSGWLESNRAILPSVQVLDCLNPLGIAAEHVVPCRGEGAQVTQRVRSPSGSVLDCVLEHVVAANEHHQRRLLEGGKIGIHDLLLRFGRWHGGIAGPAHVPFAPPADRAEIQTGDVGMTVVTGSKPFDEVKMGGEDLRIVKDRHFNLGTVTVPCLDDLPADVSEPFGMIRSSWIR